MEQYLVTLYRAILWYDLEEVDMLDLDYYIVWIVNRWIKWQIEDLIWFPHNLTEDEWIKILNTQLIITDRILNWYYDDYKDEEKDKVAFQEFLWKYLFALWI